MIGYGEVDILTSLGDNMPDLEGFGKELTHLVNKYGLDNWTNTADYLVASMLVSHTIAFAVMMSIRPEPYALNHDWSTKDANGK